MKINDEIEFEDFEIRTIPRYFSNDDYDADQVNIDDDNKNKEVKNGK
jgi:hypothetical protein